MFIVLYNFLLEGNIACQWVKSWITDIETVDEYCDSKAKLFDWLKCNGVSSFERGASAIREWIMTSFFPNEQKLVRCYRLHVRGRDEMTTSAVEGNNGVMKRGPMAVTPSMSIAITTKRLIEDASAKGDIRLQNIAGRGQAIPLWTKSPTVGLLSDFAEGIVSQNFQRRLQYSAVQGE
ncbi:MAG: hypothetical protein ACREBR_02290 [bacterium]